MKKKSLLIAAAITLTSLSSVSYAASTQEGFVKQSFTQKASQSSVEEQLAMLQNGIVPANPQETALTWAKAVKLRNGALQYALVTENGRLGMKKSLEQFHWVTGASSPWVEKYKIIDAKKKSNSEVTYKIQFDLAASSGKAGTDIAILGVKKQGSQWFVSSIAPGKAKTIGIWNTPESLNFTE